MLNDTNLSYSRLTCNLKNLLILKKLCKTKFRIVMNVIGIYFQMSILIYVPHI